MNIDKITKQLQEKYPGKFIVQNEIDDTVTEILCELEPSSEHPEYSKAIAIIDKSQPHYHKKLIEIYKIVNGSLTLYIDNEVIQLNKGDEYKIEPGKIHWAEGSETWVEVYSEPGWTLEDHKIMKISKGAGGIIKNNDKFIIVKQDTGEWTLPKGHVELKEDLEVAARRECFEETGINNLELRKSLGNYYRLPFDTKSKIKEIYMFLFTTKINKLNPIEPDVLQAKWVNFEELIQQLTHPIDKYFIESRRNELSKSN